uniref:Peptidase S1 domain-containing protein n=1 Tax=Homalodisca liturata TaxID=320908 RepID=A0A1B6HWG7_9HEMI
MIICNVKHVCVFLFTSVVLSCATYHDIRKDIISHPNWNLLDRGGDCGRNVAYRILGGKNARLGQYPWIARLLYEDINGNNETNFIYECSGTVISERYILTAAHCSPEYMKIPLISVRLGEHNVRTNPDCEDGVCAPPVQDITIEENTCHENYTEDLLHEDICILRLTNPIQFNDFVSPICLPIHDFFQQINYEGKSLEVAGWGVSDIFVETGSDVLQTLRLKVLNHSQCVQTYKNRKKQIIPKQMCVGGVIGKDSCAGDSGGPLMAPFSVNGWPRYHLIGIVSFGPVFCADSKVPGVYTVVSDYMKWILDNIKE